MAKEKDLAEEIVRDFFPVSSEDQEAYMIQEIGRKFIEYGMKRWEEGYDCGLETARRRILDLKELIEPKPIPEQMERIINLAAEMAKR